MTPDPVIHVGKAAILNCTLTSNNITIGDEEYYVNSSMLTFKFKGGKVPSNSIDLIDDKTAQIYIAEASVNDAGNYYCYMNLPERNSSLVCASHLSVGCTAPFLLL